MVTHMSIWPLSLSRTATYLCNNRVTQRSQHPIRQTISTRKLLAQILCHYLMTLALYLCVPNSLLSEVAVSFYSVRLQLQCQLVTCLLSKMEAFSRAHFYKLEAVPSFLRFDFSLAFHRFDGLSYLRCFLSACLG